MFQVYNQPAGACDLDGSSMEPGWYWVRQRASAYGLPGSPYGLSHGPYASRRKAEREARAIIKRDKIEASF